MSVCEACGKTQDHGVTLHRFPLEEELLQQWISNMKTVADGRRTSESALLCSDHFTSDCFHTPGQLLSHAVPSVFQPTEETSAACPQTSEHKMCESCEKRLHLIEKAYKLKLLSAKLKVNKCEKELSEKSHKVTKLQRKVVILKTAMKVMSMNKLKRSESSPKTNSLM